MSLPPLTLDDLTFEDLRLLAVRKIPAASGGRWTHHSPVDPGVTMLELFAFLLDQQMFLLDQVPDAMVHAILGLLQDAPQPTQAARTLVAAEPGALTDFATLESGTALRPASNALEGMVFSTHEATLLPPVAESLLPGGAPLVLEGQGKPGAISLTARLAAPYAAAHAGSDLALALILADPGVAPEWSAAAADAPPPAGFVLSWQAGGASGQIADWQDGTGGLRRSGLLRFAVPDTWAGQDEVTLTLETAAAGHAQPVTLIGAHLGAAVAEHRRTVHIGPADNGDPQHDAARAMLAAQIADWLPISNRQLELPASYGSAFEDAVSLQLEHPREGRQEWSARGDLSMAASDDRAFTVDRELGRLQFGDGYQGRVPAPASAIEVTADFGGGAAGNHAAGMAWRPLESGSDLRLLSVVAAEGGREAETLEEARSRVYASLLERHRAVTAEDYAHLVENAPGVAAHRAHVAAGHDPVFPCLAIADSVTVFVVPRTGEAVTMPRADDGALAHFRALLDEARLLTMRVFVERPVIRAVSLVLTVSGYDAGQYHDLLEPALRRYLHPALGGPEGTGWPFGAALRPSELLRVAQAVLPRGARVEKVLIRLRGEGSDGSHSESDCTELPIGAHQLVALIGLSVRTVEPAHAEAAL